MAKSKKRKDSSFQTEQTKSVFLYGKPNKEKLHCLQKMEVSFVMLVNRNIRLIHERQDFFLQVVKNDKKNSALRTFEKSIRPKGYNSAFCQAAFDYAVTHLSNRLNDIRLDMYGDCQTIFTKSKVLFALSIMEHTQEQMLLQMESLQNSLKKKNAFYQECIDTLHAMTEDEFRYQMSVFQDTYASYSLEYQVPEVRHASIPLDSRLMKLEKSKQIEAPYVIHITNPFERGKRLTVPLNTSKHALHKIKSNRMAATVLFSIYKGNIRVGWSYQHKLTQPETIHTTGVDVGITDAFCTSDGRHIGSMKDVINFYHKEVEPSFAELSSLRNKKRKICYYLRHHTLPEDVRRSLIQKVNRLEQIIRTAEAPYRKKRHYYAMLDHEIRVAVKTYMGSLTQDTLTVLEKLDIKEFQKSRKANAEFSMFARGKLQKALMDALNWQGFDFVEVVPDYTSQVCPVCGGLDSENRDGKTFTCKCCGYQDDADHVGALNIQSRATDSEILELSEHYRYAKKTLQRKLKTLLMNRHQEYIQQHC